MQRTASITAGDARASRKLSLADMVNDFHACFIYATTRRAAPLIRKSFYAIFISFKMKIPGRITLGGIMLIIINI